SRQQHHASPGRGGAGLRAPRSDRRAPLDRQIADARGAGGESERAGRGRPAGVSFAAERLAVLEAGDAGGDAAVGGRDRTADGRGYFPSVAGLGEAGLLGIESTKTPGSQTPATEGTEGCWQLDAL